MRVISELNYKMGLYALGLIMGKLCVCPPGRQRRELTADRTVTFYDMYSLRLGLIMLIKCSWSSEIES